MCDEEENQERIGRITLASVKKEMAKPRMAESARRTK
jgi:hypothetical protein